MPIAWSVLKVTLLNTLMRLCVGKVWPIAKDIVLLIADRDDLDGKQKFALALTMLAEEAKELGIQLSNDASNFLMENAVQAMKALQAKAK